ncbi:cytochrome P450 CYP82D47-like [Tripterygium wilfordii]|uniref:cytochrome P450 CYP82D47-like n=1 Tax=Tripterygium wilfordii TaxID=458696 RepID=UPI0018F7FE87|nr:cytochrome P450 CYP82D47-like [Tripterygium wilfordii]
MLGGLIFLISNRHPTMYFLLSISTAATIFTVFLFLYSCLRILKTKPTNRLPPKAGGAWPVIGHLRLLGGPQPPYKTLGDMADKYGPIFTINLGVDRALVVSNSDVAKECLTTHDKVLANRPKSLATEHLGYNQAMFGFSPYGPYWRQMRKITTSEILSSHRLEMLKHVRESEIKSSIKDLYQLWTQAQSALNQVLVDLKKWSGDITANVMFRVIVGKRSVSEEGQEDVRWKQVLRDFIGLLGKFVVADALPFLRWLDLGGDEAAMKKTAKELDGYVEEWLEEHKKKRLSSGNQIVEEDFMDVMLSILDGSQPEELTVYSADTVNKAISLGLIVAGSDTTMVTLVWALSLLLNNRHVLNKAQGELDVHIGRERLAKESDVKSLVYIEAIVKETLRLYPATPFSLPHESMEDCDVSGYHVPSGTRILFNLWKIQRDPSIWEDPCEFRPERFLTTHKHVDVKGQNFELIPFGAGRRICPGVLFSLQILQLALTNLLHGFDFSTPNGEPIDMTESIGLTNLKATPLEVLLSPRLPPHLYG